MTCTTLTARRGDGRPTRRAARAVTRPLMESIERRVLLSAGTLEPDFGGGDGFVTTNFGSTDTAQAVALQADNKIVAVGSWDGGASDFAIARYNPDGSLDTTFGGGNQPANSGRAAYTFGSTTFGGEEFATDVAIQSNGRIVVVGYTNQVGGVPAAGGNDIAVLRLNADGSLDTSFSGDGKFTSDIFFSDDRAAGVALQDDGKIVVAASFDDFEFGFGSDSEVLRLNTDGTRDTSFRPDVLVFNNTTDETIEDIAVQSDGKIVVVGTVVQSGQSIAQPAATRFNANGSIDTGFGTNGYLVLPATLGSQGVAVDITPPGGGVGERIYVGIDATTGFSSRDFQVARVNLTGNLDTSYGSGGVATISTGQREIATDLLVQPGGEAVVVGYEQRFGIERGINVARLASDGTPDDSFSGDGVDVRDFGGSDRAFGVAQDEDGSLIVAGVSDGDFAVLRYRGMFDTTFGNGGQVGGTGSNFSSGINPITALIQDVNQFGLVDRYVTAGTLLPFVNSPNNDFQIRQYDRDGNLDTSFSGDGVTTVNFGSNTFDVAHDLIRLPNGKLVVVGSTRATASADSNFAIARLNADGTPDNSFNFNGRVTVDFGFDDEAQAVVLLDNGDLLVGGFLDGGSSDWGFVRINPNGSLDTSYSGGFFGGQGRLTVNLGAEDFLTDMAKQSDGRIVAVGYTDRNNAAADVNDFAVMRLDRNGFVDSSFNSNTPADAFVFDVSGDDQANAVTVDDRDRVILAGVSGMDTSTPDIAVARLTPGGQLDASFSSDGKFSTGGLGAAEEVAFGVAVDPLGRVVVAGRASGGFSDSGGDFSANDYAIVLRLTEDGGRDDTFSVFSPLPTNSVSADYQFQFGGIPAANDLLADVVVSPGGEIVVAGSSGFAPYLAKINSSVTPAVTAAEYIFDVAPPFEKPYVALRFNDNVFASLDRSDFSLRNVTTNTTIPATQLRVLLVPSLNGANLFYEPSGVAGSFEQLPDGRYELTARSGRLVDSAGNSNPSAQTFDFYVLRGDANRDRSVTIADFATLRANFGASGVFSDGDFNYDGDVTIADFALLRANFGLGLPAAAAPAGATSIFADGEEDVLA